MGCVQSQKSISDTRPNEFYVINIDECGNGLFAAQLEITDNELILHRNGREPTKWPIETLRRYGYDTEIFSFESGRRSATGEGIYAFKCRRAEQLFNTLQQCILAKYHSNENALESLAEPPGTLPRPTPEFLNLAPTHAQSEYLEPMPSATSRFNGTRLNSVGSGPLSPEVHSPGSPSNSNILEVMPLAPLPSAGAQVTNLYQLQDFSSQREHNNNKKVKSDCANHSYLNTGDINTDLAALRHSLHAQQLVPIEDDEATIVINDYNDEAPLSPTLSTSSEHYATLSQRNVSNRLYMNLNPNEAATSTTLPSIHEETNSLQTPISNFNFDVDEEKHNYANLGPGEINYDPRLLSYGQSSKWNNATESHVEAPKINYAVLDLDPNEDTVNENSQSLPPSSPKKPIIGYTIIDFNKTEALTSVALGTEVDTEGSRKTRHNSTALPPSPTIT